MADAIIADVGVVIELQLVDSVNLTPVNIAAATTTEIYLARPDGTTLTKTATFTSDGTDGKIQFTTVASDLSLQGPYQLQAHVIWAGNDRKTAKATFVVGTALV